MDDQVNYQINGQTLNEPCEIANSFNDYFSKRWQNEHFANKKKTICIMQPAHIYYWNICHTNIFVQGKEDLKCLIKDIIDKSL